ncbi:ATP-binding cassette domain-containing protein [Flagellimonas onchidii]|uniref:ATP-binding cassette domain-containing protein n=1 Tax=Flagellimonas onchidii TaxID=2562684 RepID=UPI0010A5FD71|nr:excinuclease ABC subunit UvrA [Allomuricauda onchidii]
MKYIEIKGAKTHNLKNIDVNVPKHQLVTFTGVSGSGKSSLVFDTIYTEAQRQLIDTFSTFARRRLPQLTRPNVDDIKNIAPCIVIDQKRLGRSSRSTVGTVTEIYTYLRMLFSRCGSPFIGWSHLFSFNHPEGMCSTCSGRGKKMMIDVNLLLDKSKSIKEGGILHPSYDIEKWYWREILYSNVLPFTKKLEDFTKEEMELLLYAKDHPISYQDRGRVYHRKFKGVIYKLEQLYIEKDEDQLAGVQLKAYQRLFKQSTCPDCKGARLNQTSLSVQLAGGYTISQLVKMELIDLDVVIERLPEHEAYANMKEVVQTLVDKIRAVLKQLIDIGVGYLSLNRTVPTLSGGESQRVKLAKQLNCDLVDMIYILDEPSVGLHPRDINHLIGILHRLRDKGNSVLVVEHDALVINASDWIVDVGLGAGKNGGTILYSGTTDDIQKQDTPTARALKPKFSETTFKRRSWNEAFQIKDATKNNLKNVSVNIPKNIITCLTGVAGSGKSSLLEEFIDTTKVNDQKDKIIIIDQKPIGRTSRSNPATYMGIFDEIRKLFASENKVQASIFSFNSKGACSECKGKGFIEMELSFIDDVRLECQICKGKRYKKEVLQYQYSKKSIFDVLELSISEAIDFFGQREDIQHQKILHGLQLLQDVGLGYLKLGQSLSTLSGGEAQRVKLASELKKSGNVYVMDEPTTGLHPSDIDRLMKIINQLVESGNTVILIEHNLDVISQSDWIIDVGPEGGKNGGKIIADGTPETIANNESSITGKHLKNLLKLTSERV